MATRHPGRSCTQQTISASSRGATAWLGRCLVVGVGVVLIAAMARAQPTGAEIAPVSLQPTHGADSVEVESRNRRSRTWRTYQATTYDWALDALGAAATAPTALSKYGGRLDRQHEATGFFRVEKIGDRWWIIDPLGHPQIRKAVNSTYRNGFEALTAERQAELGYDDVAVWAADSTAIARDYGFNAWGRWSTNDPLRATAEPLPYVNSLNMMTRFGRKLEITSPNPGNMAFEHSLIPSFHPDFPAHAREYAQLHVADTKDDPWLVGHFIDNELPVNRRALERALRLDPDDPVQRHTRVAAWDWLRNKYGPDASADMVTPADNRAFMGAVFDRYYAVAAEAIREVDPNHMILGSRLHGSGHKMQEIIEAAGRHCDIVSINLYGTWEPSATQMAMWERVGESPFIISEFYVRGEDSNLANDRGAGWIVPTQRERAIWYENFTLRLLESGKCVGWDYFKFRDGIDTNTGLLRQDWRPYDAFVSPLRDAHAKVYTLVDAIDSLKASSTGSPNSVVILNDD